VTRLATHAAAAAAGALLALLLAQPPTTLDGLLGMIDRCAAQYGGADWPSLALTGLGTVALLAFAVLALGAVVGRVGR